MFVVAGSALVGLWLVARLPKVGPTTTRGAALCFVLAWAVPGLAPPLLAVALLHLPAGPAVLATVFTITAIQRLIPNKGFVEQWKNVEHDAKELAKRLTGKETATPSQTWQLLMRSRPETIKMCA